MPKPELLAALPTIERTRELTRALAVLDAVMSEKPVSRYYSFDPAWGDGEAMASMVNGMGDDWFCWFGPPGVAIVGFDHESTMSPYQEEPPELWPGLLDGVPEAFRAPVLEEPAFRITDTTFMIWRVPADDAWRSSAVELPDEIDPDGAKDLLELLLADDPGSYAEYAGEFWEEEVDVAAVAAIYRGEPLTTALVARLNPARGAGEELTEAAATGYPVE